MFAFVPWCCFRRLGLVVHSVVRYVLAFVRFVLVAFVHSALLVASVHSPDVALVSAHHVLVASVHPAASHSTMAGKEEDDYPSIHGKAITAQTSEFQRRDSCS